MRSKSDQTGIASEFGTLTYAQLAADPFCYRQQTGYGGTIAIRSDYYQAIAAAFLTLDGYAHTVFLAPQSIDVPSPLFAVDGSDVQAIIDKSASTEIVGAVESPSPRLDTQWAIFTSGTTGTPKRVDHSFGSLARTVLTKTRTEFRWGGLYDPNRMAGLQVLLQAMLASQSLYAVNRETSMVSQVDELLSASVNALSATPTLWRRILQTPRAGELRLTQITLGGEIADQAILDSLHRMFPDARITHVFASTETGAAFSVTDGRAGFPVSYLKIPPRGIELQVREGILWVRSPKVSGAGPDGFVSTGDRVEVDGDRVMFGGRDSGVVNIGGSNVSPESVETILRSHPAVGDALVTAKKNPLSGNVLVADVVLIDSHGSEATAKSLRSWVKQRVPSSSVPAIIKLVDSLDVAPSGKLKR